MKIREIVCDSCKLQKNKLYDHDSKLFDIRLKMCAKCITSNFEPKHVIMIYMATNGVDQKVTYYLQDKLYFGTKIPDDEIKQFDK